MTVRFFDAKLRSRSPRIQISGLTGQIVCVSAVVVYARPVMEILTVVFLLLKNG